MKIVCNISIGNRQMFIKKPKIFVKSIMAIYKHRKSLDCCIILFATEERTRKKYNLKGNIQQVLTEFVNEGKCTIQFNFPEHDLHIACDSNQLKGFLHLLRKVLGNEVTNEELSVSEMAATPFTHQDIAPKKLTIVNLREYPTNGFPGSLEKLRINRVNICSVDFGIFQLAKLRTLDLSLNCIEFIPEELNVLPNLNKLKLGRNQLHKSTPSQWGWMGGNLSKTLLLLDLRHNGLVKLPDHIGKLQHLVILDVSYNALKALPTGLGGMTELRKFSATNNKLTCLPGSMKNLQLLSINVSYNDFLLQVPIRPAARPTRVCSLKEYASRKVLETHLPYSTGSIPSTLVNYLDEAKLCVCGKAKVSFKSSHALMLNTSALLRYVFVGEETFVPAECYFCSLECYNSALQSCFFREVNQ